MPTNILMPALSPTMEKGNLAKWLKKEGDKVSSGDVIAEIETDKATMEYEAVDEGTLAKIVVPEGTQDVAVNSVIAVMAGRGRGREGGGRQRRQALPRPPQRRRRRRPNRPSPHRSLRRRLPPHRQRQRRKRLRRPPWRQRRTGRENGWCPHLLLAAGAPSGQGRRHRSFARHRLRPARPRRRARHRGGEIR